jgi:prephenate dehydrogenase
VLAKMLMEKSEIMIFDPAENGSKHGSNKKSEVVFAKSLKDLYQTCDTVFLAVPIDSFEKVCKKHAPFWKNHLLVDVCSVKVHPQKMLEKYAPADCQILLTHPLF